MESWPWVWRIVAALGFGTVVAIIITLCVDSILKFTDEVGAQKRRQSGAESSACIDCGQALPLNSIGVCENCARFARW